MSRVSATLGTIAGVVVLIGAVTLVLMVRSTEALPPTADTATETGPLVASPRSGVSNSLVREVGASAAADASLDPVAPPEELPGVCEGHIMTVERANTRLDQDMAASSAVVVGSIEAVGAAQWNTPRGLAPERPYIVPTRVLRLVRISVESTLSGGSPSTVVGYIPGGRIGCHEFRMAGFPFDLSRGDRFVLFLSDNRPRSGLTGVVEVWQMWPIEGDTVVTPRGEEPLSEMLTTPPG